MFNKTRQDKTLQGNTFKMGVQGRDKDKRKIREGQGKDNSRTKQGHDNDEARTGQGWDEKRRDKTKTFTRGIVLPN